MRRRPSNASNPLVLELYARTVRHEPKGNYPARLLVRPSARQQHFVDRAAEYLLHCLVRRKATEAGAEVHLGMTPVEARLREAFDFDVYKPSLKVWNDHVRGAESVFKAFADGGDVPPVRLLMACQAMAQLEFVTLEGRKRMDPVRMNPVTHGELIKFWRILDEDRSLQPHSLVVIRPMMAGTGSIVPTQASMIVDGTLIELTDRKVVCIDPNDLRRLAAKAAQATVCGIRPEGDGPGQVPVDRVALMFPRYNRLMEFRLEEIFGADGWERYLDGFAELAGMERECEMEPDFMPMMG